jgi:hypothetical protein
LVPELPADPFVREDDSVPALPADAFARKGDGVPALPVDVYALEWVCQCVVCGPRAD